MTGPARTTGPAFWVAYFQRKRTPRRRWWRWLWRLGR